MELTWIFRPLSALGEGKGEGEQYVFFIKGSLRG